MCISITLRVFEAFQMYLYKIVDILLYEYFSLILTGKAKFWYAI